LAKKFNLAGKGEREEAEADMYADQASDLLVHMAAEYKEQGETRKAELTRKLREEIIPAQLSLFEARLAKSSSGYLTLSGLTYADLHLTSVVEMLCDKKEQALAHFPHVKKLIETVHSHPKIAVWIAKRPVSSL
jgi:glutathione S-transferase